MKRIIPFLFLFPFLFCWPILTQAAQQIATSDVQTTLNVLASIPNPETQVITLLKMDFQLITFPDGTSGIRFRYISGSGYMQFRNCIYAPLDSRMQSYLQTVAAGAPTQTYTNPSNGRWFVSNLVNQTFSQSDLDWCTQ